MKRSKNLQASKPSAGDIDQSITTHAAALGVPVAMLEPHLAPRSPRAAFRRVPGVCRVCGCTDSNCRRCVELTGKPCDWVEPDLCSACTGSARIERERTRQLDTEGFSRQRDDRYTRRELRRAAECYARPPALRAYVTLAREGNRAPLVPHDWPWDASWWKPSRDRARELEKAGALFIAEAERLIRLGQNYTAGCMLRRSRQCGRKIDNLTRDAARKKGGRT